LRYTPHPTTNPNVFADSDVWSDMAGDTIAYQLDIDSELWACWKDTVPRSIALDERIEALLLADKIGMVDAADMDENHDAAMTSLIQIRRHAMRASQQLGQDEQQCRKEIRAVKRAAENVL